MPESKFFDWIKTDNFNIRIEYNDQFVIVHLPYVEKFNKDSFLEMKFLLEDGWDFFNTVGYEAIHVAIDPNNKKLEKLVKTFGFSFIGEAESLAVFEYKGTK